MQTARHVFRKHVMPYAPGPVGSVALKEANPHLRVQLIIAPSACATQPCELGIEATPRDTERPAHLSRRPDPPVLRDEVELHIRSFAK
jgi:hypothetical protein